MRYNTALSFHILAAKEMIKSGIGPLLVRGGQLALRGVRALQGAGKAIPNIGKIPPTPLNKINQLGGPGTAIAAGGLGAGGVAGLNSGSNQSMGPAFNGGIPPMPGAAQPLGLGNPPAAGAAQPLGLGKPPAAGGGTVGNYLSPGGIPRAP